MEESQAITRRSASNLALAFILLPKAKRQAMAVLYALCREVDDVADDESVPAETRARQLQSWRADLQTAYAGGQPRFAVVRELQPLLKQFDLKFEHFDDLIRGVEMDLHTNRYESMEALEKYCYRVASVVGLLSIEIFGYKDGRCRDYAVALGKALQLTNILRDVKNDAERGRIYLPLDLMRKFAVTETEILQGVFSSRYQQLAEAVAGRARELYAQAGSALPLADKRSMVAAELMGSVYWRLLRKLERQHFDVFGSSTTGLSKAQKIFLILRTWLRMTSSGTQPNYGPGLA